jgi:hypothetical protein
VRVRGSGKTGRKNNVIQKRSGFPERPDRSEEFVRRTILDLEILPDPKDSVTVIAVNARLAAIDREYALAVAQCGGEQ